MSVLNNKFRKARKDYSPYLFHFINGNDTNPYNTMGTILKELKLKSQNDYICFSASPLTSISKFFKTKVRKTGNPMYCPYGIGFSRDILVRDFKARNVIYYDISEKKLIPPELEWRSLLLDVDHYDFEYLREWRISGNEFDFKNFPKEHMIIVAPNIKIITNLVAEHDFEFKPVIDCENGTIMYDCDEVFKRQFKGVSVEDVNKYHNDFDLSGSTINQIIGQDMLDEIIAVFPMCIGFDAEKIN